jgi:hypothetical protein
MAISVGSADEVAGMTPRVVARSTRPPTIRAGGCGRALSHRAGTVFAVYFVNSLLKSRATALEDELWEALP